MTAVPPEFERPCTPRKRLELAKEVDRESAVLLDTDASPKSIASSIPPLATTSPSSLNTDTPRGGLRDFCESFVGTVVKQATSRRLG